MRLTDSERRERQQQLQRTMTLLVHASACDNQNCPSTNCNKVKQLFKHAVACQQKVQGGCHLCRSACLLSSEDCAVSQCTAPLAVKRDQYVSMFGCVFVCCSIFVPGMCYMQGQHLIALVLMLYSAKVLF